MKSLIKNKMKNQAFAVVGLVAALSVTLTYQNCAPVTVESASTAESLAAPSGGTISTTFSENLLENMVSVTGVTLTSAQAGILNFYYGTGFTNANITAAGAKSRINENGKATGVNAPMWMAVTNLSGEICNVLVAEEAAKADTSARRFFNQFNFAQGFASQGSSAVEDAIRRMSRSFWARNETVQERALISSAIQREFGTLTAAASSRQGAMAMCAAMLSSLDAHKQ